MTKAMNKGISALDEDGKAVDWWFVYKIPKLKKSATSPTSNGYEYIYYDSNIKKIVQSPNLLTDGKGALDLTLKSIFDKPTDSMGWILYNDEIPKDADRNDSSKYGHSKGVLAFDLATKTAFWLLHSWPKYADPESFKMPTPEYGQTFMCISLDLETASKIAAQMINHQTPQVYSPRIPKNMDKSDPIYLLSQPFDTHPKADSDVISYKSRGGLDFKLIAKNKKWNKDFWNDLVGPTLKTNINVESWIRGKIPPILDSDGIHKTFDIKYIDLRPLGFPWVWSETHDHTKWGISVDSDWVCIGDMNRMVSQRKRGGGTIAFQDSTLWTALSKIDLIVAPSDHKMEEAKRLIKETHTLLPLAKNKI